MSQNQNQLSKKVPVEACRFAVPLAFDNVTDEMTTVPVEIKARDGGIVDHWWWGRTIHDMEGMERHKDHLTIDYCHDSDEVLGYMDSFDTSDGSLYTKGELILMDRPNDRATEIVRKSKAGVQYEASIDFDGPLRIEEVGSGVEVEVNGQTFVGPVTIFRQWSLRGVAICPHGYDRHTETKFRKGDRVVAVETTNNQSESGTDTKAELQKFVNAFGKEKGTDWFLDGTTFDSAKEKFSAEIVTERDGLVLKVTELTNERDQFKADLEKITSEHTELTAKFKELEVKNTELTAKVNAFDRGEETPMETEPEGSKQTKQTSFSGSPALDAFAKKHSFG